MAKLQNLLPFVSFLHRSILRTNVQIRNRFLSSEMPKDEIEFSSNQAIDTSEDHSLRVPKLTVNEILTSMELGDKVAVQGWVRSIRRLKNHYFLSISDGLSTKTLQVVVPTTMFSNDSKPEFGSSVFCVGTFAQSKGKEQSVELLCSIFNLIGHCKPADYPFLTTTGQFKDWKVMRAFTHLRPRAPPFASLMRFRDDLYSSINNLMREHGYIYVTTPILTTNECEGGCKSFRVKSSEDEDEKSFFNASVKLTVSAQLHLESAACALSKVYTIGPVFRAENTRSTRHLNEFTMYELEEAFIDNLDSLVDRAEHIMQSMAQSWLSEGNENLEHLHSITEYKSFKQLTLPYFRITYEEAVNLINKRQKIQPIKYGEDLSPFHESIILKYFEDRPTFITHFPMETKPFYMKMEGDKALCFDLIAPVGGEVCGGSLREDNLEIIKSNMEKKGITEDLDWYLDLRIFGNVPHGGFGFGFDRMVQTYTGLKALKDVVPFPRFPHKCQL